jgi:hypothetical protein
MKLKRCIQCGRTEKQVVIKPKHVICTSCAADNALRERYGYIMKEVD